MEEKVHWFSWARIKKTDPILVALTIGHGITDWYPGTLYIVLPYLAKDLGLTYSEVGILMGWNSFSSFFVNVPGGIIVDMVGKIGFASGPLLMPLRACLTFFLGSAPAM